MTPIVITAANSAATMNANSYSNWADFYAALSSLRANTPDSDFYANPQAESTSAEFRIVRESDGLMVHIGYIERTIAKVGT